jgi:hypothetical protein
VHLIPRERRGLALKEMTPAQRHLAHGLLSAALSHRGYLQATTIMSLEQVLQEIEQGRGPVRDPSCTFHHLRGTGFEGAVGLANRRPSPVTQLRHCRRRVSVTPSVMGTNPAEVREGPRAGLRVLAAEEDLGRELAKSLDAGQPRNASSARQPRPTSFSVRSGGRRSIRRDWRRGE